MTHGKNRDDFAKGVKDLLAHRAGFRCSKPDCRAATAGPSFQSDSRTSIGVAAHITAAAPGGPRFDKDLSREERQSSSNGIWLCSTHAREIDVDEVRFSTDVLKAWKVHAEEQARAMLGRPVTSAPLDVNLEVSLQRDVNDGLLVTGESNLPEGTKLMCSLSRSGSSRLEGQARGIVYSRRVLFGPFTKQGTPWKQGWYQVELYSYFNGPWNQPSPVLDIVGKGGDNLVGSRSVPIDPDVEETEYAVRAIFECVAPPLHTDVGFTQERIKSAIGLLHYARLSIPNAPQSSASVTDVINEFKRANAIRDRDGWSAREISPGLIEVSYSYWNGQVPDQAIWHVLPRSQEYRYRNRSAKILSWLPQDD